MKKLFIILFLSFSISLISGCSKDVDNKIEPDQIVDKDIGEDNSKDPVVYASERERVLYQDKEYGFTLGLPLWWKDSYKVEGGMWIDEINRSINFNYINGNISSDIFSIVILDEEIKKEDWEDPFLTYITGHKGKTYCYISAMEPSEELSEDGNEENLKTMIKMVEEVPEIIETFNIGK